MLVLTRCAGEKILIGNDIEIVVLRVTGKRVTIGINAPTDVAILRAELERHNGEPPRVRGSVASTEKGPEVLDSPSLLEEHQPRMKVRFGGPKTLTHKTLTLPKGKKV